MLPPRLQVTGDIVHYRFANGLIVRAEVPDKDDPLRILSLGPVQFAVLSFMFDHPELARNRRVLEPFAGCGAFGFMALMLGATRVDLVDVNGRARRFHHATMLANGFAAGVLSSHTADVTTFVPPHRYGLIVANPPFLPTPDGVPGTLSSNGGPDGNRLVAVLLYRLSELLEPDGTAIVCLYQLLRDGVPLVVDLLRETVPGRPVELFPLQVSPVPFDEYCDAYRHQHPSRIDHVERWRADLLRSHGPNLEVSYYVALIGPVERSSSRSEVRLASTPLAPVHLMDPRHVDHLPVDGRRR